MADLTLFKPIFSGIRKRHERTQLSNIAYVIYTLFCFWAGSQFLIMLINAPGVIEHLLQTGSATRPPIEMGIGVSSLFGISVSVITALLTVSIMVLLRLKRRYRYLHL
ncbi:DUF2755 family protein [Apirhabdus apintestini]|nr:DUF2755 family protein [Enterobacteriaceae bacterium CA-0114]